MVDRPTLIAFTLVALIMVVSPGPNQIYLISRSVCQGRGAGLLSLLGIATGFVIYMLCVAFGFARILTSHPAAFTVIRTCGALYLAYLAWQAVKKGASGMAIRELPPNSPSRLFWMGLTTNLLNPKAAALYLTLLPQFIRPSRGDVFMQTVTLGSWHIVISVLVNAATVMVAGSVAAFLSARPALALGQRWLMATVLCGLALHMFFAGD